MSSGRRGTTDRRRDPDFVGAEAAMRRAARRAQQRARAATSAVAQQPFEGGSRDTFRVRANADSRELTFSQAEGYEEVPRSLKLEELPREARTQIWNLFYAHLDESKVYREVDVIPSVGRAWEEVLRAKHVLHNHLPLDEWTAKFRVICRDLRDDVETLPFNRVFDLIQFVLRHPKCPPAFIAQMKRIFEMCRLAYTIDENDPPTIVPAVTAEEGIAVIESLRTLRQGGLVSSVTHLRKASECINHKDWAGSIRESIHAVESVARQIAPEKTDTLTQALGSIDKRTPLHCELKKGLKALYWYTSDEQGVRHALLDGEKASVGMDEAVFMLGTCASFASYLWRKHKAGEST